MTPLAVGRTDDVPRDPGTGAAESEQALVARAARDRDAFGQLYVLYAPRIFRYLATRTRTVDEAADLTQLVFTRALGALGRYQVRQGSFGAWLFRIATNAATDLSRRHRPSVDLAAAGQLIAGDTDPYERAVLAEDLRRLRLAIAELGASERELLALRFAGGLTSREIASVVGRSEDAVKKQLWRTLRLLKERCRDD